MAWRVHRTLYKPIRIIIFPCAGKAGCSPLDLYARVRTLCAHCTRDRGCSAHPVFPAPSVLRARKVLAKLGRNASRDREVISVVIPGQPEGLSPESITTIGIMDSGPAPSGASRNDGTGSLNSRQHRKSPDALVPVGIQKRVIVL